MTEKQKAYFKDYQIKHRDRLRAYSQAYYKTHKKQYEISARRWRKNNPERFKQIKEDWRIALRDDAKKWRSLVANLKDETDTYLVGSLVLSMIAEGGE